MADLEITPSARDYLASLLEKQDTPGTGVRIFVLEPGTPHAETCLAYCKPGEEQEDDQLQELEQFRVFLETRSLPFLEDGVINYAEDRLGGQLTIKAPNAKVPRVSADSPVEDRVNYVLYNEINPALASHGGMVSLVEVAEGSVAVLRFGGGCQGCGMVDVTLKQGVEKALLDQVSELTEVRDVTDHSFVDNAYYQP